jgi:hypothetical protein
VIESNEGAGVSNIHFELMPDGLISFKYFGVLRDDTGSGEVKATVRINDVTFVSGNRNGKLPLPVVLIQP